eukprot:TRINITY_DN3389_c0_g2_i2.p3 TRINITY_DN3389_c0_g2~~TRINITY_DN3389_c0_g2_i2.p3  ORF type:complete len:171 (-),score=23.91 TRINITY_DN3389_c0_g2_i2:94-606(-)
MYLPSATTLAAAAAAAAAALTPRFPYPTPAPTPGLPHPDLVHSPAHFASFLTPAGAQLVPPSPYFLPHPAGAIPHFPHPFPHLFPPIVPESTRKRVRWEACLARVPVHLVQQNKLNQIVLSMPSRVAGQVDFHQVLRLHQRLTGRNVVVAGALRAIELKWNWIDERIAMR